MDSIISKSKNSDPIVIVGTGPAGIRVANELLKLDPNANIVMYGDEPWEPYDRVALSSLLAGEVSFDDISNQVSSTSVVQHHNCEIIFINKTDKHVVDVLGNRQRYSKLILAIGSSAHVPNIPGNRLSNVYTFRKLTDIDHLMARRVRSRCTVVIGGGLLGLEAARAMQKNNTKVVLVEHSTRLMSRQIDDDLSEVLLNEVIGLGIDVRLASQVKNISGSRHVESVELNTSEVIECDSVILATGIRPNKDIALTAGLIVGRGIKVNNTLQTSDPDIFAIGECCEHKGEIYGLVAPGYEQAAVVARFMNGDDAQYLGSITSTKLKVFGLAVKSVGETGDKIDTLTDQIVSYKSSSGNYRTLVLRHRKLIGAMGIGEWGEFRRIEEAVVNKRHVWPWQLGKFIRTGDVWLGESSNDVSSWPANALICNCKGITRGELSKCISQGVCNLEDLQQATNVSTVCGTCKPLVTSLLGESQSIEPALGYKTLGTLSVIVALILSLFLLLNPIPYSDEVGPYNIDNLWIDPLIKQITGYTIASLTVIGIVFVSLRKRLNVKKLGEFSYLRIAHVLLSLVALTLLVTHTGLNWGDNLNFLLLITFILASFFGVVLSLLNANEHKISPAVIKRWRHLTNQLHIVVTWPLPVFLGFHITSVYYF